MADMAPGRGRFGRLGKRYEPARNHQARRDIRWNLGDLHANSARKLLTEGAQLTRKQASGSYANISHFGLEPAAWPCFDGAMARPLRIERPRGPLSCERPWHASADGLRFGRGCETNYGGSNLSCQMLRCDPFHCAWCTGWFARPL